jgi:PAS domain S-box-containing protein
MTGPSHKENAEHLRRKGLRRKGLRRTGLRRTGTSLGEKLANETPCPELRELIVRVERQKEELEEKHRALDALLAKAEAERAQAAASEAKYRLLVENQTDLVIKVGIDGTLLFVSPSYCRTFGKTEEELVGSQFMPLVHEDDRESTTKALKSLFHPPHTTSLEQRVLTKAGWRWFAWAGSAVFDENGRVIASIAIGRDITEKRQAEDALRASEAEMRALISAMTDVVLVLGADGRYLRIPATNPSLLYKPAGELVGKKVQDVFPQAQADVFLNAIRETLERQLPVALEYSLPIGDKVLWFSATLSPLSEDSVVLVARDITERVHAEEERTRLESQLVQAQKMESVGRLAGGIAHDFNNMLTPIMGYAELLSADLASDDPHQEGVKQIIQAAERSRDLVWQLLAFARKQTLEMKPVDLNAVLRGFEPMLRRTLQENITLKLQLVPALGSIQADIGQLEQIVMNLAVNAQDAMPEGGRLFIDTSEMVVEEATVSSHHDVAPGSYVVMSVSDTGVGMDKETLHRLFEPFYSTKSEAKGSGLGLATVYGIVKQHGGHVRVYSEPGYGALFRIYFPRLGEPLVTATPEVETAEPARGGETLLVVEDEAQVRRLVVEVLRKSGYTALAASGMRAALATANAYAGEIHLLVTDVILEDGNGRTLYETLAAARPSLRVLYMSGYTANVIGYHGVLQKGVHFIQKPFSLVAFTRKVRKVLRLAPPAHSDTARA